MDGFSEHNGSSALVHAINGSLLESTFQCGTLRESNWCYEMFRNIYKCVQVHYVRSQQRRIRM